MLNINQSILRFRGRRVKAEYREAELPEWEGNPWNLALKPVPETPKDIMHIMSNLPDSRPDDHIKSLELRLRMLPRINYIRQPHQAHIDLFRALDEMIREGYRGRNPASKYFQADLKAKHDLLEKVINEELLSNDFDGRKFSKLLEEIKTSEAFDEDEQNDPIATVTTRKLISGISGCGKTEALHLALKYQPQVIHHQMYNGKFLLSQQLAWLKVECPPDGTVRGLCLGILMAIDSVMKTTNFYKHFASDGRASKNRLAIGVALAASMVGLGVLVIDHMEVLHAFKRGQTRNANGSRSKRNQAVSELLAYLLLLDNLLGIPIVFVGTPAVEKVLLAEDSLSFIRRILSDGYKPWGRMLSENKDKKSWKDWQNFVNALCKHQYTGHPFTSDLIIQPLYNYSQGIVGVAVPLYKRSLYRAITTNHPMSPQLIRSVFNDEFFMLQQPLEAIKTNNRSLLSRWDDIFHTWQVHYLNGTLSNSEIKVDILGSEVEEEHVTEYTKTYFQQDNVFPVSSRKEPKLLDAIEGADKTNYYEDLLDAGFIRDVDDLIGKCTS